MRKIRVILGISGSLLLCFLGIYRLLNESLSTGPLIFSIFFVIAGPISAIAMVKDYKRQKEILYRQ
ncbi:hypothetical protein [Halobacillus amylolyticus]|uniref:Uncharacterized protein n=1 Tax=Halobacillus amylolyticus TaxID=2932259 RepID=A0ABY4HDS1_9BACI|nr:hypothetical protein [Halobacillus amylolyticus]UOR12869.1 hypothetical protein MUO15_04995 [Halobacillus amylolyticus]